MNTRTAGRVIGGLVLAAFPLYLGGSILAVSTTAGAAPVSENAASLGQLAVGATLLLINSIVVATIGALAFTVLRRDHALTAKTYLGARSVEAALLALAPLGVLILVLLAPGGADTPNATGPGLTSLARTLAENADATYSLAMATLGIGSIFFCRALGRSGLLPRFLAVWGMAGYAIFAVGSVLELVGYPAGLVLSVPGGLFEVAAGCYLLVKGFRGGPPRSAEPTVSTGRVLLAAPGR